MKIYTEVIIDMRTDEVISEKSYEYIGPVTRCGGGGGGGSAGEVTYPSYIENGWKDIWDDDGGDSLATSMIAVLDTMTGAGGNPYDSEAPFDPNASIAYNVNSPLKAMHDEVDAYESVVDAVNKITDWDSIYANALAEVNNAVSAVDVNSVISTIISNTLTDTDNLINKAVSKAATEAVNINVDALVTAVEASSRVQLLQSQARLSAGLADINAVNSSAMAIAMAMLEDQHLKGIEKFRQDLKRGNQSELVQQYIQAYIQRVQINAELSIRNSLQHNNIKSAALQAASAQMMQIFSWHLEHSKNMAVLQMDATKTTIIAMKEKIDRQLEIDVRDARWDLDAITQGANLLGNIAGGMGSVNPGTPNQAMSALAGAGSGAALGASIGSVVPGIGTGIGAVIGGIGGALAGVFG